MSAVIAPTSPYKGLAPFDDSDADALLFFGRERESEIVAANLLASRLTVLYGPSGVGKSSLLRAGVLHLLRAEGVEVEIVAAWTEELRGVVSTHVVLDQFEEAFLYHDTDELGVWLEQLLERRVDVLVAIREDALAQLDAFKARVPNVLANYLRLDHLDRDAARAAIESPLERWNELTGEHVTAEPQLVETLLEGLASPGGRIEAPYLQLVLERLWDSERERGSSTLRLATLRELGGAEAIVGAHVERALEGLTAEQKDVAAQMFDHLVTPSGTKIAHRLGDLAEYAHVPPAELEPVLATLGRERIVRAVDGANGGGVQYEIFHDVLADPVLGWRTQRELERGQAAAERRQRRLLLVAAASIAGLAVMAAITVFALTQRSDARSQARHARSRELAATALTELSVDPARSLRLALDAAGLEPSRRSEDVLRQALVADHLRRVVHVHHPVRALAIVPDGVVADVGGGEAVRVPPHGDSAGSTIPLQTRTDAVVRRLHDVGPARAAALAPGGRRAATVAVDPEGHAQPRLWDLRTGKLEAVLPQRGATAVLFSPYGGLLASTSRDGTTRLWRSRDGKPVRTLDDGGGAVNGVAFSPDGTRLATAGADGGVRVWDAATGARIFYLIGHANPVEAVAFSPDGALVVSASRDRTARVWAVAGIEAGRQVALLAGDTEAVTSVVFTGPHTIVTGSEDGEVRFWDARIDERLEVVARGQGGLVDAAWSPRGLEIAAVDTHGVVDLWSVRGALISQRRSPDAGRVSFASDGRVLVGRPGAVRSGAGLTAAPDGTVRLRGGRVLRTRARLLDAELDPAGTRLVTAHADGDARVWDVHTGRLVYDLRAHFGRVPTASFSDDGRWIVTAGPISAGVWAADTGRLLFYLRGPSDLVTGAWFAPDSEHVLATSLDRTVRVYDCILCRPLPRLVELARRRLAVGG